MEKRLRTKKSKTLINPPEGNMTKIRLTTKLNHRRGAERAIRRALFCVKSALLCPNDSFSFTSFH